MSSIKLTTDRIVHHLSAVLKRAAHGAGRVEDCSPDCMAWPGTAEFRTALGSEFASAVDSGSSLAVIYLDIPECPPDRRNGIGSLMRSFIRNVGKVFLYSPSCIAFLLPNTDSEQAAMLSIMIWDLLRINFPESRVGLNIAAYPQIVRRLEGFEALAPGSGFTVQQGAPERPAYVA